MRFFARGGPGVVLLGAALFLLSACGSDSQDEAESWVNEAFLLTGDFQEAAADGKKKIAAANTPEELSQAYSRYAALLRENLEEFEQIEPPDACADEQRSVERFMRETTAVTEELIEQDSLTPADLRRLEDRTRKAARGFVQALRPILVEGERC